MLASMLTTLLTAAAAASVDQKVAHRQDVELDFFLVQDLSSSYNNDLPNLVTQIPEVVTDLVQRYPKARFGFSSFVDKPMGDFGYADSGDYCYQQHLALSDIAVHKNEHGIVQGVVKSEEKDFQLDRMLSKLTVHSGKDWKENQLGAVLHAILSAKTGWKRNEDPNRVNILALATDAGFHQAGDGLKHNLVRNTGAYKHDPDVWCMTEDYPSLTDIEMALDAHNTKLLLLVTPDMVPYYKKLLQAIGEDRGVVVALDESSEFIGKAVAAGIDYMENTIGFGIAATKKINDLVKEEESHMTAEEHKNKASRSAPAGGRSLPPATNTTSLRLGGNLDAIAYSKALTKVVPDHKQVLSLCHPDTVFEVMIVQDASDSYTNEVKHISQKIADTWSKVTEVYPGSKIGLTSFVDKPIEPYGYAESGDYCASLRVPLGTSGDAVKSSYDKMVIRSGADWKEGQLHGMLHSVYTHSAGWNQNPFDVNDKRIVRVAVTITDAGYHQAGDTNLKANNGDRELDCTGEDYPSALQVSEAFKRQLVFPAFLVTSDVQAEYEDLLHNKMKLNGAVIPIDTNTSRSGNVDAGLMLALASVCNQSSLVAGSAAHKAVTENTPDGVVIHLDQMPKYLAVVAKD